MKVQFRIVCVHRKIVMNTIWFPDLSNAQGPKYLTLTDALRDALQSGDLAQGEKLPPVREVAYQLGITPGTVARAYSRLVDAGCLEAVVGRGTFVTLTAPDYSDNPRDSMSPIFEDAIERVGGERSFPYDRIAEVVLVMLAKSGVPDEVRALIDRATRIENDRLQEAVADAAAQLAGVDDPVSFVQKHINRVGYDRLTQPQRVVYCASCFDAEVCNGGLMQFFGNSSGDHAVDTLEALEQLAHTEAVTALTKAMHAVGPLARETDRDTRMDAFAGRFDELVEVFRPLEGAFYKSNSGLRARMTRFAVEHAEDFR